MSEMYQAYKGYFQDGRFVSSESVEIPDNVEVYVMLVGAESPTAGKTAKKKNVTYSDRQAHRAAFNEFFKAMAEIDDEPLDEEFDAILAKRVNISRELDL